MYITLSSKNESNNSSFTNYFQDTLVIPPNSKVCLVNASLVISESTGFITIGANQFINVMCDAWNIVRIPLTAGNYTLQDWCDLQNAQPLMTQSNPVYYFRFTPVEEKVNFEFYRHQGPLTGFLRPYSSRFAYNEYFNGNNYNFDNRLVITSTSASTPLTFPPNSIGANNVVQALYADTNQAYQVCTHYDSYTPIRNWDYAVNGKSMDFNRYMGEFCIQLGTINQVSSFILCRTNYNETNNYYQVSPTEYLASVEYSVDNKISLNRKDVDGNNQEVVAPTKIRPGSFLLLRSVGAANGGGVAEFEFGQKLERLEEPDGLQLWIPMDFPAGEPGWLYNNGQGNSGSYTVLNAVQNIINSEGFNGSDAEALAYYNLGLNIGKTGWRAGYKDYYINDEYVATDNEGITRDGSSMMPNGGALNLDSADEQRIRLFENSGTSLFANGDLDSYIPSLFMITFKLVNDGVNRIYTLLGGNTEATLYIDTSSVNQNVGFRDREGNLYQTAFGGHQIVEGNWYTIGVATFGNFKIATVPQLRILLMESNGGYHFTDEPIVAVNPTRSLAPINTIGGVFQAGQTVDKYCHGAIGDFRYYQHNEYSDVAGTTYWDALFQQIANYSVNQNNLAVAKPKNWFGVLENVEMWTPQSQNDYNAAFAADGTKNMYNMLTTRDAGANEQSGTWYDFSNIGCSSQNLMINPVNALTTINTGSDDALSTEGVGLVNGNNTDADTVLNLFLNGEVDSVEKMLQNADPTLATILETFEGGVIPPSDNEQVHNVNIKNLPHFNYDGNRHQISKTIYQLPALMDERKINQNIHKCYSVPQKVYTDLKNPGEIILNSLEVEITDENGKEDERLTGTTNISIEIQNYD